MFCSCFGSLGPSSAEHFAVGSRLVAKSFITPLECQRKSTVKRMIVFIHLKVCLDKIVHVPYFPDYKFFTLL